MEMQEQSGEAHRDHIKEGVAQAGSDAPERQPGVVEDDPVPRRISEHHQPRQQKEAVECPVLGRNIKRLRARMRKPRDGWSSGNEMDVKKCKRAAPGSAASGFSRARGPGAAACLRSGPQAQLVGRQNVLVLDALQQGRKRRSCSMIPPRTGGGCRRWRRTEVVPGCSWRTVVVPPLPKARPWLSKVRLMGCSPSSVAPTSRPGRPAQFQVVSWLAQPPSTRAVEAKRAREGFMAFCAFRTGDSSDRRSGRSVRPTGIFGHRCLPSRLLQPSS